MKRSLKLGFLFLTILAAVLAAAAATYAWFTTNREVSTGRAQARTGQENLELQISSDGGASFLSTETAAIRQVNRTDAGRLMPVSTADLVHFVMAQATVDGMASSFVPVTDESYYYHGRIYIRAVGEGLSDDSGLDLYLDQSDGLLGEAAQGTMLNAARLGLMFDGDPSSAVILRLSESENAAAQQTYNTVIGGVTLGKDQVLSSDGTAVGVRAAADPSLPVSAYTIDMSGTAAEVPARPLLHMELNQIYPVDIYFYLEGCDPDCSDGISYSEADLHLAFYGVLSQRGGSG